MTETDKRKVQTIVEKHVVKLIGSLQDTDLISIWDTALYESLVTAAVMTHIHAMEDMEAWHRAHATRFS